MSVRSTRWQHERPASVWRARWLSERSDARSDFLTWVPGYPTQHLKAAWRKRPPAVRSTNSRRSGRVLMHDGWEDEWVWVKPERRCEVEFV